MRGPNGQPQTGVSQRRSGGGDITELVPATSIRGKADWMTKPPNLPVGVA